MTYFYKTFCLWSKAEDDYFIVLTRLYIIYYIIMSFLMKE